MPRQRGAPGDRRREGRPAADDRVGLRHRAGQEGLPVRRPAARVDRGGGAAARDARLQRHLAGDPEDLPPARRASIPNGIVRQAARPDREGGRGEDLLMEAAQRPRRPPRRRAARKKGITDRARAERKLGLDAVRAGGDRDAARHRLSDRLRRSTCRCSATTCASPTTRSSSGSRNYGDVLTLEHLVARRLDTR